VGAVGAIPTPPPSLSIYYYFLSRNVKIDPLHPLIGHGNALWRLAGQRILLGTLFD